MENWIHSLGNYDDVVLNTQIRLSRNFNDIPFSNKLPVQRAKENNKLIYEWLKDAFEEQELELFEISQNQKNFYDECIDKYLIDKELLDNSEKNAFIVNNAETVSILLNYKEHIKINCITAGLNLEETLNKANIIDDEIEKNYEYAFDERIGYLMSSPKSAGTGLQAKIVLHLPALTLNNDISKFSKSLDKIGMKIKSKYCDSNGGFGSIYEIYTGATMGLREQDIIGNMKGLALNIISEEKKAKEVLIVQQKNKIYDKIFRAYAILKSAILLEERETIEYLSYLRLGVELDLLSIAKSKLNEIMIKISDSFIKSYIDKDIVDEQVNFRRANLIREILS